MVGTEWLIEIQGYAGFDEVEIAAHLSNGKEASELVGRPGNFVICATNKEAGETYVITSAYGAIPYFYMVSKDCFYHAPTVAQVMKEAGQSLVWDYGALVDLVCLEHLTGERTLHREVRRTPAGSVLHFRNGRLETKVLTWEELHGEPDEPGDVDQATELLLEEVARFAGDDPVVFASAGFDSRLLLAALLRAGRRPRLVVAGSERSTDRIVAEEIAAKYKLAIESVELRPEDFAPAAETIAMATNGTKPALHWHTYLYPQKAQLARGDRLFVGANGEFARSYYWNKGIFSQVADWLPGKMLAKKFWERKSLLSRTVGEEDYGYIRPEFAESLRGAHASVPARLWELHGQGGVMEHLDQTYLYERVRHFISNGLALYALAATPVTPFLSRGWVSEVWRLPRRWKLGSAYHRRAIEKLEPGLLDFREEGTRGAMTAKPVPFYYVRNKVGSTALYDRREVFGDRAFGALLPGCAEAVGDLVDPGWVRTLSPERHQRLVATLLPVALWRRGLTG